MKAHLFSYPLVALDDEDLPCGIGSGCMIDVEGKRLLLGVSHVAKKPKRWSIHLEYVVGKGAKNYVFGAPTYLAKYDFNSGQVKDCDFFCVEIPCDLVGKHQKVVGISAIESEETKLVFTLDQIAGIASDVDYSFFGLVMPELCGQFFECHPTHCEGLRFERDDDVQVVFKLDGEHPGHDFFKGCSGAPIIDGEGSLVALVTGGNDGVDELYAFPLKPFVSAISTMASTES